MSGGGCTTAETEDVNLDAPDRTIGIGMFEEA
jgi:hypothetical protein